MKGRGEKGKDNAWLLIKKKDEASVPGWDVEEFALSIKTGRTQEEIASDAPAHTKTAAGKKKLNARLLRPWVQR